MVVLRRPQEADRSISGALNDQSYQSRERATKSRGFPKAAGSSFAGAFARRAQTAAHLQKRDTADDYGRGRSRGDSRNGRAGLSAESKDFMKPCQLPLAVAAYLSKSSSHEEGGAAAEASADAVREPGGGRATCGLFQ